MKHFEFQITRVGGWHYVYSRSGCEPWEFQEQYMTAWGARRAVDRLRMELQEPAGRGEIVVWQGE